MRIKWLLIIFYFGVSACSPRIPEDQEVQKYFDTHQAAIQEILSLAMKAKALQRVELDPGMKEFARYNFKPGPDDLKAEARIAEILLEIGLDYVRFDRDPTTLELSMLDMNYFNPGLQYRDVAMSIVFLPDQESVALFNKRNDINLTSLGLEAWYILLYEG